MAKKNIGTFLGTGNTLTYLGDHAYAYGGKVGVPQSTTTLLSFETGKQYVKGMLAIQNSSGAGDDIQYEVLLNGVVIMSTRNEEPTENDQFPMHLIFPPHTTVLITGYNISSGAERDQTAIFVGRVYA